MRVTPASLLTCTDQSESLPLHSWTVTAGDNFQCSDSCHSVVGRSSVYLEKVAISLPPPKGSSMILYPHKHFGWRYTEFSASIDSHHDQQESPNGSIPNEGWIRYGFIPQVDRKFTSINLVKSLLRTGYVNYVATFGLLLDPGPSLKAILGRFQRNSNLLSTTSPLNPRICIIDIPFRILAQ